jgi:hypothetical protein
MASLIYDAALYAMATGQLDFVAGSFKAMLVGAGYKPDKAVHSRRSDVTGEISGKGYAAGGADVDVSASQVGDATEISLGGTVWGPARFGALGAVYYRARGQDPTDDELVAFVDFGDPVVATNGDFTLDRSVVRLSAVR